MQKYDAIALSLRTWDHENIGNYIVRPLLHFATDVPLVPPGRFQRWSHVAKAPSAAPRLKQKVLLKHSDYFRLYNKEGQVILAASIPTVSS